MLSRCNTVAELARLLSAHAALLDSIHDVAACNRLASLAAHGDPDLDLARIVCAVRAGSWLQSYRLGSGSLRQGANVVFAVAKLGAGDPALHRALVGEAARVSHFFDGISAVNALWAATKLGLGGDASLIEPLIRACASKGPVLGALDCSSALWSLATLEWGESASVLPVVRAASAAALSRSFKPGEAVSALWALGIIHGCASETPGGSACVAGAAARLASEVSVWASSLTAPEAANVVIALARLGVSDAAVVSPIAAALHRTLGEGYPPDETARQLLQAHLALRGALNEGLVARCVQQLSRVRDTPSTSPGQREVTSALSRLGLAPRLNVPLLRGALCVGAVLDTHRALLDPERGPSGVIVQYEPRQSFLRLPAGAGTARPPKRGDALLRDTLLSDAGFTLLALPCWEWDGFCAGGGSQEAAADAYLRVRLAAVGVVVSAAGVVVAPDAAVPGGLRLVVTIAR